jgi:hypothetical protein
MKTQSRTEYLMECLSYHERRLGQYEDGINSESGVCTCVTCIEGRAYHRTQVKWFLRKLSEPVRSTPKVAPKPDFDKPFRDSIAKAESLPVKKPQYPEEELTYENFNDWSHEGFKEYLKTSNPEPKPNLFKQLWTFLKGF